MWKFTQISKRTKYLFIANIFSWALLIALVIKANYFEKIYDHLFKTEKIESYPYSLNPKFQEQVDYCSIYKSQANIVMLGNSLTYRMNWNELMDRNDIVNRGVGADITQGFIARLNFVFAVNPKICFIEGGINDLDRNIPPEEIEKNIRILVDSLKNRSIIPVISLVLYVTKEYPNSSKLNKQVVLLNERLAKLALEKKIQTFDLNKYLSTDNYLKSELAESDGIHLTGQAYLIWKNEIEKILKAFSI